MSQMFAFRLQKMIMKTKFSINRLAQNVPTHRFFLNLPRRKVMIYFGQKGKNKWGGGGGVTDFVLKRTCPEKYPKYEKSGFANENVKVDLIYMKRV